MENPFVKLFQFQSLNILLNTEMLLPRLFWELETNQEPLVAQNWVLESPIFTVKYTNIARLFA